jgi:hypothetical protein
MTADKAGPRLDDEMKKETENIERSGKESRVEDEREQQDQRHQLHESHCTAAHTVHASTAA